MGSLSGLLGCVCGVRVRVCWGVWPCFCLCALCVSGLGAWGWVGGLGCVAACAGALWALVAVCVRLGWRVCV